MFFKRKSRVNKDNANRATSPVASSTARVVISKGWVPASELKLGMYVDKLDKPWEQTSFMFQGFVIDSYETLKAVKSACQFASVQTQKVAGASSAKR